MRAGGSIAKLCMEIWLTEFKRRVEQTGIKVWLTRKYVDDVLGVCSMVKTGDRIMSNGQLGRDFATFGEDRRKGVTRGKNTLKILEQVANQVLPFLKFTGEAA